MQARAFITLILSLSLTISATIDGMKRKYSAVTITQAKDQQTQKSLMFNIAEAKKYNVQHQLILLPADLIYPLFAPLVSITTEITEQNFEMLKEEIKAFFALSSVCNYLKANLKFPWLARGGATKNAMLKNVNQLMDTLSWECYSKTVYGELISRKHPDKVAHGYNRYRHSALALIYSGASADVIDSTCTTILSKAVHAKDAGAVALLLNKGANPYQNAVDEDAYAAARVWNGTHDATLNEEISYDKEEPIFFRSTTVRIAQLLSAKIDKQQLFENKKWTICHLSMLCEDYYESALMKFWLDYGLPQYGSATAQASCMLHILLAKEREGEITIDNALKKMEYLLIADPTIVNIKNGQRQTPLDTIPCIKIRGLCCYARSDTCNNKIGALLKKYGAKTSAELRGDQQCYYFY